MIDNWASYNQNGEEHCEIDYLGYNFANIQSSVKFFISFERGDFRLSNDTKMTPFFFISFDTRLKIKLENWRETRTFLNYYPEGQSGKNAMANLCVCRVRRHASGLALRLSTAACWINYPFLGRNGGRPRQQFLLWIHWMAGWRKRIWIRIGGQESGLVVGRE